MRFASAFKEGSTSEGDRERYIKSLCRSLKPGGYLLLATFAEDGPEKCSGLTVEKYSLAKMIDTLGADFELIGSHRELHPTPFNTTQTA